MPGLDIAKMYALRIPFELPSGYQITDTDKIIRDGNLEFKLKKENRFYVLVIKGFDGEIAAENFIANSWAGLMWFLLNCGLAPLWKTEIQPIVYTKDPVSTAKNLSKSFKTTIEGEVHGFIDGSLPAIFETRGNYRSITGGKVNLISGTNADRFFKYFFEGIECQHTEDGFNNEKLKIALELYGAFFSEATQNARFLTLVMVLECLAESEKRSAAVLSLIDSFKKQIEEIETAYHKESDERISFESLKRELAFRKEDSIRKKIRSLVFKTLSDVGDTDALETAKKVVKVYDKRSTLVHEGSLPSDELSKVSSDARTIVERVLKAKFIQTVNGKNV